ncbi:MAG: hydroxymethylbilane synthase [Gemmatimonadales bacterium]|nr:MAG: hydroxymethylbilane synthase [Gemmatimonadales bacterium]
MTESSGRQPSSTPLRLGTRGSLLAMTQSGWVADRIRAATGCPVELVEIRTTGDADQERPLSEIGGRGLFTRELDRALLDDEVDLAVHSLKDLPTRFPEGLSLGSVPVREDVRDVLIGPEGRPTGLSELPRAGRLGTSSLRRQGLALAHRSDLDVAPIRGNLDTRISKVDSGEYDAIVLAAAGVRRLGWMSRVSQSLDSAGWLPAPAQGALGIVVRTEDLAVHESWLSALQDHGARASVAAERQVLHALEAGCQLPVGALAIPFGSALRLKAVVISPDGQRTVRAEASGDLNAPEELGDQVARLLVQRGARRILDHLDPLPNPVSGSAQEGG